MSAGCPTCRDVVAALAPRGTWPAGSPQAALAVVRAILDRPPPDAPPEGGWAAAGVHRTMLADAPRTDAFRRALEAVVRPGDVVIDVGAGTGVLAAFAARAGAAEVHAVERSGLAATLAEVVRRNALEGVVRVHRGDARTLELPRARVIVAEWLGNLVFGDGMWPAVVAVRDRCLAEGGVLVPARADLLLAPVEDAALREQGPGWFDAPRWGLDLTAVGDAEAAQVEGRPWPVAPSALLAPAVPVVSLDCARDGADAGTFARDLRFEVARDGTLDALAGWFTADLAPGVLLDTGPGAPLTHWKQHAVPLRPRAVRRGQRLDVHVRMDGPARLELRVALDGDVVAAPRVW